MCLQEKFADSYDKKVIVRYTEYGRRTEGEYQKKDRLHPLLKAGVESSPEKV